MQSLMYNNARHREKRYGLRRRGLVQIKVAQQEAINSRPAARCPPCFSCSAPRLWLFLLVGDPDPRGRLIGGHLPLCPHRGLYCDPML